MNEMRVQVEEDGQGQRLDAWLAEQLQEEGMDVSRSQVQVWMREERIVGPRRRIKASDRLQAGEVYIVHVPAPAPVELEPIPMDLDIAYEDDDVVVVNKPRGVVVHPGAGHLSDTLVNGLLGRGTTLSSLGGAWRPGVVHRIDKDTSGLIVFAKTDAAYHGLAEQLADHRMHRVYHAIAHGEIPHAEGTIEAPIGRDPHQRQRMAITPNGKHAVTHFRVIELFHDYTYVELKLETGRTHQIRVHMTYIGHPLAGDPVYGPRHTLNMAGQALHAMELGFEHPRTKEWMGCVAPLPEDMQQILGTLTPVDTEASQ